MRDLREGIEWEGWAWKGSTHHEDVASPEDEGNAFVLDFSGQPAKAPAWKTSFSEPKAVKQARVCMHHEEAASNQGNETVWARDSGEEEPCGVAWQVDRAE